MECPACGGPVTLDVGPDRPPTMSLTEALLAVGEDEDVEVVRACWDCGWHEARQMRVASIETTNGDADAVKRSALIDEITDELAAIDSLVTLEQALAEVRRQRRLELAMAETDDDISD